MIARQRRGREIVDGEKSGAQPVVDVVIDIGDVVGQRRELRFQPRPVAQVQRPALVETGDRSGQRRLAADRYA